MDTGNAVLASSFPEPVTTLSSLDHKVLESDSQDGAARMVIHGGLSSRGVDIFPDASLQSPVAACWQFLCTGDLLRHGVDPCGHVPTQECRGKFWTKNFPFCSYTWAHDSEHFSPLIRQDFILLSKWFLSSLHTKKPEQLKACLHYLR